MSDSRFARVVPVATLAVLTLGLILGLWRRRFRLKRKSFL